MSAPRVWAPHARQVELVLADGRQPMQAEPGGWWRAPVPLAHGARYAFALDGAAPLPDPRSRWQPEGVHAASAWVDPQSFAWSDAGWQPPPWTEGEPSAVIYELHIGTFSAEGTFAGAIAHLDHLVTLGVTHVELMPVAEFAGARGWGYDGVALYAPHHAYGGPLGLQQFVDACHQRGLAVLLDVVYNHLGPVGNYLARYGPYFTERYHTPWGAAVNFDGPASDEVRAFFIDNAIGWVRDFHMDGLRLDAVHAILDQSALPFLEQLARAVHAEAARLGREVVLVAESDANDPRLSLPEAGGGLGLDAQWDEDFHHALHAALTGEQIGYFQDFGSLAALAAALEHGFYLDGRLSRFRHRRHGRAFGGHDGARLVVYAQNHDQAGNRARGERLGHLLPPGLQRVAAALTLLAPEVPLLFQGEAWGASTPFLYFTDYDDPALAQAVREGRRRECAHFGWPGESPDPNDPATFARSRLDWSELTQPAHAALFAWYRALIQLRRSTELGLHDLRSTRVEWDEAQRWMLLHRGPGWRVACNLARRPQPVALGAGPWKLMLASNPPLDSGELAPESVAIYQAEKST